MMKTVILSFVVALVTVWNLRMTGVTIANSASCGYEEHQHTQERTKYTDVKFFHTVLLQ